MITANRALANRSGDQQARAELLAELLHAAGEQPVMLRHDSQRAAHFLVALEAGADAAFAEVSFTAGERDFIALPLGAGVQAGEMPPDLRAADGTWTASVAMWRYRPAADAP
ncbi:MAG: hypothetical protein ACOCZK_00150 [Planctomycetota bacterium]